ncbi:relaxase domain-containing protein [Couchioplanes caeruleus subsp. azureus]
MRALHRKTTKVDVGRQARSTHSHDGVRPVVRHLERHGAFTRTGANGLRQVDTAGLATTVFDHRMSQEKDPQLHYHVVVSAKVRTLARDGEPTWLAPDGKALYQANIGARVAYERALEGELTRRRGVQFTARPGSTIREIVGTSR